MATTINYNNKIIATLDINLTAELPTSGYCMDTDLELVNIVNHYDGTVEDGD